MKRLLPPTLVLLLLLVFVPLGLALPLLGPPAWPCRLAGLIPVIGGILLTRSAHRQFESIGTTLGTFADPARLVTTGPFALTRNPMYLGLEAFLIGVALAVGSLTVLLAPVAFGLVADRWYIPFEEKRMESSFGHEYDEYRARVPRWIGAVRCLGQLTP